MESHCLSSTSSRCKAAIVGSPPPNVVLPTRRKTPVSLRRLGAGILFFRSNAQGLHLAVEVAALEPQQLRGAAHVAFGFLELLENVVVLGGLANVLQAPEMLHWTVEDSAARTVERNMAGIDAGL